MIGIIACEESQVVTNAFNDKGHDFMSLDILPCTGGNPKKHIKDDVFHYLNDYDGSFTEMINDHKEERDNYTKGYMARYDEEAKEEERGEQDKPEGKTDIDAKLEDVVWLVEHGEPLRAVEFLKGMIGLGLKIERGEGKEQPISFKDQSPKDYQVVLFWDSSDMARLWQCGYFVPSQTPVPLNITHWMPLPNPPEIKDTDKTKEI